MDWRNDLSPMEKNVPNSQLLTAVNRLVMQDSIEREIAALNRAVSLQSELPVVLAGDLAALNPLLQLAIDNPDGYRGVLGLIARKRVNAGRPMPHHEEPRTATDYMREFMQQKRERERRAVRIENMARSERERLIGKSRINFMRATSNKWKERRDHALEAARERRGGSLPREEMTEVLRVFWDQVDRELDELESLARQMR